MWQLLSKLIHVWILREWGGRRAFGSRHGERTERVQRCPPSSTPSLRSLLSLPPLVQRPAHALSSSSSSLLLFILPPRRALILSPSCTHDPPLLSSQHKLLVPQSAVHRLIAPRVFIILPIRCLPRPLPTPSPFCPGYLLSVLIAVLPSSLPSSLSIDFATKLRS